MKNFSCCVKSVEEELNRKLNDNEMEFMIWLFQQQKEERRLRA